MSASKKPSRGTCHWSSQKRLITQLTTTHTRIRVAPPSTIHLASHVIVVNTIQFFTSASAHSLIFGPLLILRLHRLPPNHTAIPNLQLSRLKEVKSPMEMHIVEIGGKLCHYSLLNTCFIFTYFFQHCHNWSLAVLTLSRQTMGSVFKSAAWEKLAFLTQWQFLRTSIEQKASKIDKRRNFGASRRMREK